MGKAVTDVVMTYIPTPVLVICTQVIPNMFEFIKSSGIEQ